MARGKQAKKIPQFNTEFVRCELTTEDKKNFAKWTTDKGFSVDTLVTEVLQSNHKISFSFSEHNDSFICSVTGKPDDCDNAGKCYTSHAKDYITALYVALFKFHVIWDRGPWETAGDMADFG